jgi:hypothetical protein
MRHQRRSIGAPGEGAHVVVPIAHSHQCRPAIGYACNDFPPTRNGPVTRGTHRDRRAPTVVHERRTGLVPECYALYGPIRSAFHAKYEDGGSDGGNSATARGGDRGVAAHPSHAHDGGRSTVDTVGAVARVAGLAMRDRLARSLLLTRNTGTTHGVHARCAQTLQCVYPRCRRGNNLSQEEARGA